MLMSLSLAIANLDWEKVESIANRVPSEASTWTLRQGFFEGIKDAYCLPLHQAVVTTAPVRCVQAIISAYPNAAKSMESSYSRLPLHCACRRANADLDVIRLLLLTHPAACLVPDSYGRLPLHYALSNGAGNSVIHMLLTTRQESAKGVDLAGWTPLHVACASGCDIGVIEALLRLYPEAIVCCTDKGSTPAKCLSKNVNRRVEIKELLKVAKDEFEATFVDPLKARPTLLRENSGVLV